MADNIFVNVTIHSGRITKTVKMEKGTSFENKGGIYTADKDGLIIHLNNYQMQVFQAVANNYNENNSDEIILSKKDIDIAIQKYSSGKLGKDLGEFLGGNYKVKNPKAYIDENKISAYITNGKTTTSAVLCFKYDNKTNEVKPDSVNSRKPVLESKNFANSSVIVKKPFSYTFKKGDNLLSVAKEYEVDTYQLIAANPQLKEGVDYRIEYRKNNTANVISYIKEGTAITIPARYSVKDGSVRNFNDLCRITGLSRGYIEDLLTIIEVSPKHPGKPDLRTYNDGYGMPTIGYGHTGTVDGKPLSLRKKINISEIKALQLLAEDLIKHEAMVIAYLGKENYDKTPDSVKSTIVDIAYNKGIWDGFLNPYHNQYTKNIKQDLQNGDYAKALSDSKRITPNRGLKRRNIYRFISGLTDLSPSKREVAMKDMNAYYRSVLKTLKGAEYTYLKQAWENAKSGKVTGYRIQITQKDRG